MATQWSKCLYRRVDSTSKHFVQRDSLSQSLEPHPYSSVKGYSCCNRERFLQAERPTVHRINEHSIMASLPELIAVEASASKK